LTPELRSKLDSSEKKKAVIKGQMALSSWGRKINLFGKRGNKKNQSENQKKREIRQETK